MRMRRMIASYISASYLSICGKLKCTMAITLVVSIILFLLSNKASCNDLFRTNPSAPSNEDTNFIISFFGTHENTAFLYIGRNDHANTEARISISFPLLLQSIPGYPKTVNILQGSLQKIELPKEALVRSSFESLNGIHVSSINQVPITVIGVISGNTSNGAFLALPCTKYKTREYKYFIFSKTFNSNANNSKFLIVPCEDHLTISYALPDDPNPVAIEFTRKFQTILVQRSTDLTGTVVTSSGPLSVFVGHECGQKSNLTECDFLIEQIPPHVTYGTNFLALPYASRQSGSVFRVGSVLDDNMVNITCTQSSNQAIINDGEHYEFRTSSMEDFCCIETSLPATVMQYALGHSSSNNTTDNDFSMSYVPPIEQYRNNYLISTFNTTGFMSYALSTLFFNNDTFRSSFLVDSLPFFPGIGSEIVCNSGGQNGFGAYTSLSSENTEVSYDDVQVFNEAVYVSVYGFTRTGHMLSYPAGYECEPIGLPQITVFGGSVSESDREFDVRIRRTGGDLSLATELTLSTAECRDGNSAQAGIDFESISNVEFVYEGNNSDIVVTSVIIHQDSEKEVTECFEIILAVENNGFTISGTAQVNIEDDDNRPVESNEGTNFVMGFFAAIEDSFSEVIASLIIGNPNPTDAASVTVEIPSRPIPGFPQSISVPPGDSKLVSFPIDILVSFPFETFNGIHITSTNNVPVSIYGISGVSIATDTFLLLPCTRHTTNIYKYFVFSAASNFEVYLSRFLIVPCEDGLSVLYTLPTGQSISIPETRQFQTHLVEDFTDLTGTIIESNGPLSVFVGHDCANVPSGVSSCDLLVEQIPSHATYGTKFFALPFALRQSGDIFRVGSLLDNNAVNVTCTRRSPDGNSNIIYASTTVINNGQHHEFRTSDFTTTLTTTPYRREFCCIESSLPATVMQYSLGHGADEVNSLGDPSITLVPPVDQYRDSYLLLDKSQELPFLFQSFMSYALPAVNFDPTSNDIQNFFANGLTFLPGSRENDGSEEYIPIFCSNNEVCGYGAFSRTPLGDTTVSYNGSFYMSFYGISREGQWSHPVGFKLESIGLPHITVFDVTVREGIGQVRINFERTGGDLTPSSRITATTAESKLGRAQADLDFISVSNHRIRFSPGEILPRYDSQNQPFVVTILDDDEEEMIEYFEVLIEVESNGYPFPSRVGRVTILDDDALCQFQFHDYNVTEKNGNTLLTIKVITNFPMEVNNSCLFSTRDGSALGERDYVPITDMAVDFQDSNTAAVSVTILNDKALEDDEVFYAVLSNSSGVPVQSSQSPTRILISDDDVANIGFDTAETVVLEDAGAVQLTFGVLEGYLDIVVNISFFTLPDTAEDNIDYNATTANVSITGNETYTISVPINNDMENSRNRTFFAELILNTQQDLLEISQKNLTVIIVDNDVVTTDPVTSETITTALNSVSTSSSSLSLVIIFSVIAGVALLIVIVLAVVVTVFCFRKSKSTTKTVAVTSEESKYSDYDWNHMKVRSTYKLDVPKYLVIDSCNLQLNEPVGQGEFGIVYKGRISKGFQKEFNETVAIKTLKGFLDKSRVKDLLQECTKMSTFDHPNVLSLIGVCLDGGPVPYIVMPFMFNGSLLAYLKKERDNLVLPPEREEDENTCSVSTKLTELMMQVAKGMEYLASKKVIHRDLAARNCMIDMNFIIKVADFGLSETIDSSKDYFRQGKDECVKLPVKWLALECLQDGIFSEKSDVWAFGVTCWEIFTGGKTPYGAVVPVELQTMLEDGYRMDKPKNAACSDPVYDLMQRCWEFKPENRPTFSEIVTLLSQLLENTAGYMILSKEI